MQSARETWFLMASIPLYSILILAEILMSNWGGHKFYSLKVTLQNVYLSLVNAGLDLVLRWLFYISVLMWGYEHRFFIIDQPFLYWFLLFYWKTLCFI